MQNPDDDVVDLSGGIKLNENVKLIEFNWNSLKDIEEYNDWIDQQELYSKSQEIPEDFRF